MLRNEATQEASRLAAELRMCLFDPGRSIGVAADWIVESSVEGAWVSGTALATAVLTDVGCNVGREAALLGREQENLLDLSFLPVETRLQEEWATRRQGKDMAMLLKVVHRWLWWLPAAKALVTWQHFTHHAQQIKSLFAMCFATNNELTLCSAWEAWEEVILEVRDYCVVDASVRASKCAHSLVLSV